MEIGEYVVVIENEAGTVQGALGRASRAGRPVRGEVMVIDNERYRVDRVEHEDERRGTHVRYTVPRLYLRPINNLHGGGGSSSSEPHGRGKVVPLATSERGDASGLPIALARLVMIVVACGHRAQIDKLRGMRASLRPDAVTGAHRQLLLDVRADIDHQLHRADVDYQGALRRLNAMGEAVGQPIVRKLAPVASSRERSS